jgi:hypothetical protein
VPVSVLQAGASPDRNRDTMSREGLEECLPTCKGYKPRESEAVGPTVGSSK